MDFFSVYTEYLIIITAKGIMWYTVWGWGWKFTWTVSEQQLMCWHVECLLLFRGLDIKHAVTSVTHLFSRTLSRKHSVCLWWTMVRHGIEQHMFLVENYIGWKNSYQQCVCKYADKYSDSPLPSKLYALMLYKNGMEFGRLPTGINQSKCWYKDKTWTE
jgi:hypothetical protein